MNYWCLQMNLSQAEPDTLDGLEELWDRIVLSFQTRGLSHSTELSLYSGLTLRSYSTEVSLLAELRQSYAEAAESSFPGQSIETQLITLDTEQLDSGWIEPTSQDSDQATSPLWTTDRLSIRTCSTLANTEMPAESNASADSDRTEIVLESAAHLFGDGNHVSTRLCLDALEWLVAHDPSLTAALKGPRLKHADLDDSRGLPNSSVSSVQTNGSMGHHTSGSHFLDFGAGIGSLVLAASALGFQTSEGCEVESEAFQLLKHNLEGRKHPWLINRYQTLKATREPSRPSYDVITCNIQPPLIYEHLTDLARLLKSSISGPSDRQGYLVTSGFTTLDRAGVEQACKRLGLHYLYSFEQRGWLGLIHSTHPQT